MKRTVLSRIRLGIPLGVTIGQLISIAVSLIWGGGYYSPCVPQMAADMGSEINAVILQTFLCGLLGAAFGGCSAIWQVERWNLVQQTGIYFLIVSCFMLPTAYFCYWMEHSPAGFLQYFGVFALIFAGIWLAEYWSCKRNVRQLNSKLPKKQ